MKRVAVALVVVVAASASVSSVAAKADPAPPGYHTVTVKKAGISIAVPDRWITLDSTRPQFQDTLKKLRKANPALAQTLLSQKAIAAAGKNARLLVINPAGAEFHDNMNVLLVPGISAPPTEDEVKSALQGSPNLETRPVIVAGANGVEAAYHQDVNLPNGGPLLIYTTQYAVANKLGTVLITFTTVADARQDPTAQTMIHSLQLLR